MNGEGQYDDIIGLPHHVSPTRKPMSMEARAAQFAPFAALTGHEAAIKETARLTDGLIELSEDETRELSAKFNAFVEAGLGQARICHFVADSRKAGGAYVCERVSIRRFDEGMRELVLSDGRTISLANIADIVPE